METLFFVVKIAGLCVAVIGIVLLFDLMIRASLYLTIRIKAAESITIGRCTFDIGAIAGFERRGELGLSVFLESGQTVNVSFETQEGREKAAWQIRELWLG